MQISTIYKIHALSYLQQGYSVIPDMQGSKAPMVQGWNEFCGKMPTLEQVNEWASYSNTNLALCLGAASGVIALDLDTDDEGFLSKIAHLLPESPIERKGSKGWARFFKFSGEANQELFEYYVDEIDGKKKKRVFLELLSHGKKITIAPSIHPKGMEYIWTKQPLLSIKKEDLPTFPSDLFAILSEKLALENTSTFNFDKISAGRNMSLSSYCSELIRDRIDFESSIQKLIAYDIKNNDVPLFSDIEENKTPHALINAAKFFTNHLESINIKRQKNGLNAELPLGLLNPTLSPTNESEKPDQQSSLVSLPSATGILKDIQEYILERSYVEQPVFALGAAVILLGTLISRKMIFQGSTPNLYLLNIASSGSGKDSCQQALKALLTAVQAHDLVGAASYPSEASILVNLSSHPTRLDIIDEASSFLKSASHGGAAYQTGIGDVLCELFSCSNEKYLGKILASNGGKRVGDCNRPHLNILCSTTPKGISEGISQSTLEKGLFARFLTFFGENHKPAKRIKMAVPIPKQLVDTLQSWYTFSNPDSDGDIEMNKPAYSVRTDPEADILIDQYFYILDKKRTDQVTNLITLPIISRLFQQMLKIALIHAVSSTKKGTIPKVKVIDVQFAYQFINFFYQNIEDFVENTVHDDARSAHVNKMLLLIKRYGTTGVTHIEIMKNTRGMKPQERIEIIKDLLETQMIGKTAELFNGTSIHRFFYIGD